MRLFIGLPLPPGLAARLAQRARALALPHARLSPPENLHITLVFLGQAGDDRLPAIQSHLAQIQSAPLDITVGGLGAFPGAGVLFAQVEPTPELLRLQAKVSEHMAACGFAPELRPYHPHITLARSRSPSRAKPQSPDAAPTGLFQPQHFVAKSIHLYRSLTTPAGSQYEVLVTQAL